MLVSLLEPHEQHFLSFRPWLDDHWGFNELSNKWGHQITWTNKKNIAGATKLTGQCVYDLYTSIKPWLFRGFKKFKQTRISFVIYGGFGQISLWQQHSHRPANTRLLIKITASVQTVVCLHFIVFCLAFQALESARCETSSSVFLIPTNLMHGVISCGWLIYLFLWAVQQY